MNKSSNEKVIEIAKKADPALQKLSDYYGNEIRKLTLFKQTLPIIR